MERKSGMAAIAVLIAVLGFSFVPRRGGEPSAPTEPAQRAKPVRHAEVAKPAKPNLLPACEDISERVSRFYPAGIAYPSSCYASETKDNSVASAAQIPNFAIALVPNPAQTNLPVVFDRSMEAIQQAAQDENYAYDGSWFPWTDEKSYDRFGDEEKAEALQSQLQQQPGVIAFRRSEPGGSGSATEKPGPYDGGLLVFVVGEQPTGGINDEQFENALAWLKKLGADPAKNGLQILGPTFSGSLPSLQRELSKRDAAGKRLDLAKITVYSGTANSNESIDGFRQFLCGPQMNDCPRFRTFLESDKLMTHRFLQFVRQSCYKLQRVAILSEDETAFGAESARASKPGDGTGNNRAKPAAGDQANSGGEDDDSVCKKEKTDVLENLPTYLYYPRDIATLRSAYSKQSIFSQGQQQGSAPSSALRGDLGEAASSRHDTVQTYAGELTPYMQEATLFGIVNVLQAKHIQFVVIRSSNSLDQLFLSEFLRRSYPGGRVVLDGADLLFRRGMQGDSLRGVMLLSTYPLLAWTQDQVRPVRFLNGDYIVATGAKNSSYRIFGDELSEGVYIAARGLFSTGSVETRGISDYGPPLAALSSARSQTDDLRPPTWLTVVGHRQFWPIAVLNDVTLNDGSTPGANDGKGGTTDLTETESALLAPAKPPGAAIPPQNNAPGAQPPASDEKDASAPQGRTFPADATALVLFCCAVALAHFLLCWSGCMIGAPRVRAYFAPIPMAQQPVLIFIGSLLLGVLAVSLGGATGLLEKFYAGHQAVGLWSAVVFLVVCGLAGFVTNYRLPLVTAREQPAKKQAGSAEQELSQAVAAGAEHGTGVARTVPSDEVAVESRAALSDANTGQGATATPQPEKTKTNGEGFEHWREWLLNALRYARDRLAKREIPVLPLAILWAVALAVLIAVRWHLSSRLTLATRSSAFWRNAHISNGVSGLLPQVLLILGFYAWFWYNLRGLSLFGEDRPVLPGRDSLPESFHRPDQTVYFESQDDRHDRKLKSDPMGVRLFSMFSAEQSAAGIEEAAHPLGWFYLKSYIVILLATTGLCWLALGEQVVQTLGDRAFGRLIFFSMCAAIALILTDTLQFARTWGRLRQLLVFLDRLRLRRTLACLKGLSWKSVLSMSSNVLEERYCLISRQLESARNLQTTLEDWQSLGEEDKKIVAGELKKCEKAGLDFAEKYTVALSNPSSHNVRELKCDLMAYQQEVAKTAGRVMTHILLPAWRRERQSLILEAEPPKPDDDKAASPPPVTADAHVRAAEEFFVLPYVGFIQNILGRVRTIAIAILLLFMATTLALSSYPFSPTPALGAIFLVLFVLVGAMVVFVYAEMHRDATLSHITQTRPGQLGFEFWSRIVSFGIGPLIGLMTTLFPSITDFVVSWLQPGAETMK